MRSIVAVLLLTVAVAHGWSFCDDADKWIAFVPVFAAKDLDLFVAARNASDHVKVAQLLGALVDDINAVDVNNKKLIPRIGNVVSMIQSLANTLDSWWSRWRLRVLVKAVDGNRDNESYYRLDAAREWIQRRLFATSGQLNSDLKNTQNLSVTARDFLDEHAQVFVQGIKTLVRLTDSDTEKNAQQIQAVANEMTNDFKQTEQLNNKTLNALSAAQQVQNSQQ